MIKLFKAIYNFIINLFKKNDNKKEKCGKIVVDHQFEKNDGTTLAYISYKKEE